MPGSSGEHRGASTLVAEAPPLLRLRGLSKWFPGVQALDQVDFDLRPGEVHVLFGEPVHFRSVSDARRRGISAVFQEFSLVPDMTVEENLFLGDELTTGPFLNKRALHRRAEATLTQLGFPLRPGMKVNRLSRAEQQMVEIAKALRSDLSILILDEPTAALTERETDRLFQLLRECKRRRVGIVYITHRMDEIHRIGARGCRAVTVPRRCRQSDPCIE